MSLWMCRSEEEGGIGRCSGPWRAAHDICRPTDLGMTGIRDARKGIQVPIRVHQDRLPGLARNSGGVFTFPPWKPSAWTTRNSIYMQRLRPLLVA